MTIISPTVGRFMRRAAAAAIFTLPLFVEPAFATTIERVVSPGGIEAWLVHEPAVPLIAIDFAFAGGAAQDPPGKVGTANLVASLLDEGAGDLDSKTFHARLERKAIELNFQADRDTLRGTMRTLTENRDEAFEYLRLSLTAPRFDPSDVEIIRSQVLSNVRRATTSPNEVASLRWWQTAFADHPYGRPVDGTLKSVPTITVGDLKDYTRRVLARSNLKIAVVGDIDAEAVKVMLDRVFGALPAQPELTPVANVSPHGLGRRIVVKLDVPQAVVHSAGPVSRAKIRISWPPTSSTISLAAVRSPRGCTRRCAKSAALLIRCPTIWYGSITPRCSLAAPPRAPTAPAKPSISSARKFSVLPTAGRPRTNWPRPRPTSTACFALNLDTSSKIAALLVQLQLDGLGIDYFSRRPEMINAVTLDDARRVAKRLLDGGLLVTVAGRPAGVVSTSAD